MALNLKFKPRPAAKEITLPSAGYPYKETLPGGKLLVNAFDWDAERLLYKDPTRSSSKEMLRYIEVVKRVSSFPKDFDPAYLLEGDLQFILLHARSLSYGEEYSFNSRCPHCRKEEEVAIIIPDGMPVNRYPADFEGTIKYKSTEENEIELRFLTVKDDMECDNLSRQRLSKNAIKKDGYDDDYQLNRLSKHLVSVNGGKAENLQEAREWLKSISSIERSEITTFINEVAPGASYRVPIDCIECAERYYTVMPIGADFFRPRKRTDAPVLPGGVRIGVFGTDIINEVAPSSGTEDDAPNIG